MDKITVGETVKYFTKLTKLLKNFKCGIYFQLFRFLPINKNKIVIMRHCGKGFGCHVKYIALKLLEEHINCELVWIVNNINYEFPTGIRKVKNTDWNRIYELATAAVWIDNTIKHRGTFKRKEQFYINTTHGIGVSLKKFSLDSLQSSSNAGVKNIIRDGKIADVYLSGSKFISQVYKSAYKLKGTIVETGSPRVDILIQSDRNKRKCIKKRLGFNLEDKIVLYAPTFRQTREYTLRRGINIYDLDQKIVKDSLKKKMGGEWKILYRFHPKIDDILTCDADLNVSQYDDMQELLLISDVLITDYSSVMFEASFIKIPVFLYASDLEHYNCVEREFYFEIDKLPFSLAEDNQQLDYNINKFDKEAYLKALSDFMKPLGLCEEGNACEKVVDIIVQRFKDNIF